MKHAWKHGPAVAPCGPHCNSRTTGQPHLRPRRHPTQLWFNSSFGSGMVLQQAPSTASVYGQWVEQATNGSTMEPLDCCTNPACRRPGSCARRRASVATRSAAVRQPREAADHLPRHEGAARARIRHPDRRVVHHLARVVQHLLDKVGVQVPSVPPPKLRRSVMATAAPPLRDFSDVFLLLA